MSYMLSSTIGAFFSTALPVIGLCGFLFDNSVCTVIGVLWIVFETVKDFLQGRNLFFSIGLSAATCIFLGDFWQGLYIGMLSYSFSMAFCWLLTIVLSALTCHVDLVHYGLVGCCL